MRAGAPAAPAPPAIAAPSARRRPSRRPRRAARLAASASEGGEGVGGGGAAGGVGGASGVAAAAAFVSRFRREHGRDPARIEILREAPELALAYDDYVLRRAREASSSDDDDDEGRARSGAAGSSAAAPSPRGRGRPPLAARGDADRGSPAWCARLAEFEAHVRERGDAAAPVGSPLAAWVLAQRRARKRGALSRAQVEALDALGFVWDAHEERWARNLAELREFREEHGHCAPPRGTPLWRWCRRQLDARSAGRLAPERAAALDELNFPWEVEQCEELLQRRRRATEERRRLASRPKPPQTRRKIARALELSHVHRSNTAFDLDLVTYLMHTAVASRGGSASRGERIRTSGLAAEAFLREAGVLPQTRGDDDLPAAASAGGVGVADAGVEEEEEEEEEDDDDLDFDDEDGFFSDDELEEQLDFDVGIDGMFEELDELGGGGDGDGRVRDGDAGAPPPARSTPPAAAAGGGPGTDGAVDTSDAAPNARARASAGGGGPAGAPERASQQSPLEGEASYAQAAARWGRLRASLRRLGPWTHAFFEREGVPPSYADVASAGSASVQMAWTSIASLLPDAREEYFRLRRSVELSESDVDSDADGQAQADCSLAGMELSAKRELLSEMNLHFYLMSNAELWLERLDALRAHVRATGSISMAAEQEALSAWLASNRLAARRATLGPVRLALLAPVLKSVGIDVSTEPSEAHFQGRVHELREWLAGAPAGAGLPPPTERIGRWALRMRRDYRAGRLPTHRKTSLDALGYDWAAARRVGRPSKSDAAHGREMPEGVGGGTRTWVSFSDRLNELRAYRERHGDTLVTQKQDPELASFLARMRHDYRAGLLKPDKAAALAAVGAELDPDAARWLSSLKELRQFRDLYGHARVPSTTPRLGRWCKYQRDRAKAGTLSDAERAALDELGFVWVPTRGRPHAFPKAALPPRDRRA